MLGFTHKLLRFAGTAIVVYILIIGLIANLAEPLLFNGRSFTNVPLNKPGGGLSVLRFREADTFGKVDILFVGSSHCYRTFDTAWYAQQGLRTFNLGSTSQSPINSYHVANDYLKTLDPELVVIEVYSETLRSNGTEALLDQLYNRPLGISMFRMTASVGGIKAWNGLLVRILNLREEPVSKRVPPYLAENGHYVSGGFVRREPVSGGKKCYSGSSVPVNPKQLDYLGRLIESIRIQGRKIVLVSSPLPKETLAVIKDYEEIKAKIMSIAKEYDVPYFDFDSHIESDHHIALDARNLFYDYDHFNEAGVAAFNPVFLELLRREGLI